MLEKLVIKNYLLLKDIEIDFSKGLNIVTGETGAGKTILINALSLLLGERADYSIISKNKEKMIIEAFIKGKEEYTIIRRELYAKGFSRNFINDTPVNVNDLSELGERIVDIHSQNEHQSLLRKEVHLELLDAFVTAGDKKFGESTNGYTVDYEKAVALGQELETMRGKKDELENKRNFLEFQLKEIKETDPKPGEDEELENELKVSENAEQIRQSLAAAYSHLYEDNGSAAERVKLAEKELEKIQNFDNEIPPVLSELANVSPVLNELSRQIQEQFNKVNFDPERIEKARERSYKLQFLKKKYGGNLDAVIKLKEQLESDLSLLENFDDKLAGVEKSLAAAREGIYKKGLSISKTRKEKAKALEQSIEEVLKELGFENAEFKVNFDNTRGNPDDALSVKVKNEYLKLTTDGIDKAEFLVKINKGEEFLSLRKTASGGEVSRVMLAIKTVLAESDPPACLPSGTAERAGRTGTSISGRMKTLVFDEIDTGISGRIAQKAGVLLRKLSKSHQVIAITHLAQIAALAEEHFLVEKESNGEQTVTKIRKLNDNEKVIEVAKLLSGEKVTDSAIKGAKELMNK
jgi:DNA repair protein RecN (Recombination protein N)